RNGACLWRHGPDLLAGATQKATSRTIARFLVQFGPRFPTPAGSMAERRLTERVLINRKSDWCRQNFPSNWSLFRSPNPDDAPAEMVVPKIAAAKFRRSWNAASESTAALPRRPRTDRKFERVSPFTTSQRVIWVSRSPSFNF